MMNDSIQLFLIIGSITFTTTEVIKVCLRIFFGKSRIGILISLLMNTLFILAMGEGFVSRGLGVPYSETAIPMLFKYMDIFTTATILCLMSKGLDNFIDLKKIHNNPIIKEVISPEPEILNETKAIGKEETTVTEVVNQEPVEEKENKNITISHMDGSIKNKDESIYIEGSSETTTEVASEKLFDVDIVENELV